MRRLPLLVLLPLTLGLVAFVLPSQEGGGAKMGKRREKSELTKQMEVINGSIRTIARGWQEQGASPEILAALGEAQAAILAGKAMTPTMLEAEEDEAKKAEKLVAYRMEMNGLLRGFLDLEDSILAGDQTAVSAALEALADGKDAGHAEFKARRGR